MLRTRSPLLFKCIATPEKPFDLHVLTTPPAFILSQDQTLRKRESRILVIHELLLVPARRLAPHILGIMLIGGPNQSHKVNFKEPLPVKGKISKRTFVFHFVNTFSGIFRISFIEETNILLAPSLTRKTTIVHKRAKGAGNMVRLFSLSRYF